MYKNYVYFNKEKSIEKYEQKMFGNSIFSNMIKVNKGKNEEIYKNNEILICISKRIVSFLIYDEYNGADDISNLQCTCKACNEFKGSILPDDFMERITEIFIYQTGIKQGNRLLWKITHRLLNRLI